MEKRTAVSEDSEMLQVRRSDLSHCLWKLEKDIELLKNGCISGARGFGYVSILEKITLLYRLGLISGDDCARLRLNADKAFDLGLDAGEDV